MPTLIKPILICLSILFSALVLSNPKEDDFVLKISEDYKDLHVRKMYSTQEIRLMGISRRRNKILYSTYTYQFGHIAVRYVGVAGLVFYRGSIHPDPEESSESRASIL